MSAGAGGNAVVLRQRVRHLAGIVVPDIQRHHRRPGSGKIAVDRYAGDLLLLGLLYFLFREKADEELLVALGLLLIL